MSDLSAIDLQRRLIAALARGGAVPSSTEPAEVLETHISWVLLAGAHAYKFKKALNLGFLDYSSLEQRRYFCQEELRLNRRTAPDLYLDVVAVTGTPDQPQLGGQGEALEWAVKMQRFEQTQLASHLVQHHLLKPSHIDRLAATIAEFHRRIAPAELSSRFGTIDNVCQPIEENFRQIRSLVELAQCHTLLNRLHDWYEATLPGISKLVIQRKHEGQIRECHGDLHLGNIVVIDEETLPFDCIEFNDNLRFVDVMSEIAFLLMDLDQRRRSDLGWRFLDGYLQISGDFAGLALLRFYQVYRAMVRAKVAAIRAGQPALAEAQRQMQLAQLEDYLQLALRYTRPASPRLVLMHGFSGSGKSSVAQQLLEQWGAVRLRSDVERKRLFGLSAAARSGSQLAGGIYSADASTQTYERLAQLSEVLLAAGFNVIVDATFLRRADRERFIGLAQTHRIPWHLLDVTTPEALLRERIAIRHAGQRDASEADLAVLDHQLQNHEPLSAAELARSLTVNTEGAWSVTALLESLHTE